MRFGLVTPTLVQAVTSQKWGLAEDFRDFVEPIAGVKAIVQAGIDRHLLYVVQGCPSLLRPVCDVVVPVSHPHYRAPAWETGRVFELHGRQALELPRAITDRKSVV